jgi:hypothetical protein
MKTPFSPARQMVTVNRRTLILIPLALILLTLRGLAQSTLPEPGPEAGGLRLRLSVTPNPEGTNEGYYVQVDLINVSRDPIPLLTNWHSYQQEGGFKEYLEAAVSIESYPEFERWVGQTEYRSDKTLPESEYTLKPSKTLSVKWHTTGRHLKNKVSDPFAAQNPSFTENGLHSVHVSIVISASGHQVLLRSNEQLVPIGGSRTLPKHTYGKLCGVDVKTKTARLCLGSMHNIMIGDRFRIRSDLIQMHWTLTITQVWANYSSGTIEASKVDPERVFPPWHAAATLIPSK